MIMYLDTGALSTTKPASPGVLSYQSDVKYEQRDNDSKELRSEHTIDKKVYLIGYAKAPLYVSAQECDDLVVYFQSRKLTKTANYCNINIPLKDLGMQASEVPDVNVMKYLGPTGIIKANHRNLDQSLSKPHKPVLAHNKVQKVVPAEVVRLLSCSNLVRSWSLRLAAMRYECQNLSLCRHI